jgi:N-methylhydantoinase B
MTTGGFDPITLQVMIKAFSSVSDEMVAALVRTSHSTNIKDRRDCSAAIYTPAGDVVAQSELGTPLHLGVMGPTVRAVLNHFPADTLRPGDDVLINDPYPEGPGHMNDIAVISPVYHRGNLIALLANMAHHVDVGGYAPGSMPFGVREIYQEALQIPPVKIRREGVLQEDMLALMRRNVRTPLEFQGDLLAQFAANEVGKRRVCELFERMGEDRVEEFMREVMDYSERRIREGLRLLPDAVYEFEDWLEGDGIRSEPIRIATKLTISGDELTADFSGCSDQVEGPINCRRPAVEAALYYAVKCVVDPDCPANAGIHRPIHIVIREGSILAATRPAAVCNANIATSQRLVDTILGCFLQAVPERVVAACHGAMSLLNIGGKDTETGEHFNYIETFGGGQGGLPDRDGMSGVHCHMSNTRNAPVEVIETTYPLRVRSYGLIENSEGPGRFRGGFGIYRDLEIQSEETTLTVSSERFEIPPWGALGGGAAGPGWCHLIENGHKDKELLSPKVTVRIQRGDRVIAATPGGGGWGDPFERDPLSVLEDVLEEFVSVERAREAYGVVVNVETGTIDDEATKALRSSRSGGAA